MKTLRERTEIQQAYLDGASIQHSYNDDPIWRDTQGTPIFNWHIGMIYRIKPKPMEIWVNVYKDGDVRAHKSISSAEEMSKRNQCECRTAVKFIEVI